MTEPAHAISSNRSSRLRKTVTIVACPPRCFAHGTPSQRAVEDLADQPLERRFPPLSAMNVRVAERPGRQAGQRIALEEVGVPSAASRKSSLATSRQPSAAKARRLSRSRAASSAGRRARRGPRSCTSPLPLLLHVERVQRQLRRCRERRSPSAAARARWIAEQSDGDLAPGDVLLTEHGLPVAADHARAASPEACLRP